MHDDGAVKPETFVRCRAKSQCHWPACSCRRPTEVEALRAVIAAAAGEIERGHPLSALNMLLNEQESVVEVQSEVSPHARKLAGLRAADALARKHNLREGMLLILAMMVAVIVIWSIVR